MRGQGREDWRVSGGDLPTWMRRANTVLLGCAVALGLVFVGSLFLDRSNGLEALQREGLEESSALTASLSGGDWCLLLLLGIGVGVALWCARGDPRRLPALVPVGAWLVIAGALSSRRGVDALREGIFFTELPAGVFGKALTLTFAGSLCGLAGLARLALRRARRGLVLATCVFLTPLPVTWVLYTKILAPDWAQENARLTGSELAIAPGAWPSFSADNSLDVSYLEIALREGGEVVLPHGSLLTKSIYPACLADYASEFPVIEGEWQGRKWRTRRAALVIQAPRNAPTGAVLDVLEAAAKAGIEHFRFSVRRQEPRIDGTLETHAESEYYGSNEDACLMELGAPDPDDADVRPIICFEGREERTVEEIVPRVTGYGPSPDLTVMDRPRFILRVDPALEWQQTVTAIDALNGFRRTVFLERLDE